MSRRDYANQIVSDYCAEIGLSGQGLDDAGQLSLRFNDTTVTLRHVTWPMELLSVLIDLGPTPQTDAPTLVRLLELNLVAWTRRNMSIGLSADGSRVLGRNAVAVGILDVASLRATLEPMLAAVPDVTEMLTDSSQASATAGAQESAELGGPAVGLRV
jgi:hypothetical protein